MKELKNSLYLQQQAELERKINLIRYIKEIESVQKISREDFFKNKLNKHESTDLGLFCQMSLAEVSYNPDILKE